MRNDDFILDSIINILQADTEKPEDGYFRSDRERAYRCKAIRCPRSQNVHLIPECYVFEIMLA